MKLNPGDIKSPLWRDLAKHIAERIDLLRTQNDNESIDPTKTAAIRGRIAELKSLLALADPKNQ